MKGFRRSLIGIIILTLLGGYYYFYEIRYRGRKAKEKEQTEKIFPVNKADVVKIVYQKGKVKIVLEKKGKNWVMVAPIHTAADKKTVKAYLDTFPGLKSFRTLPDVKWDNALFGLSKTPVQITLYDKTGKRFTGKFGNQNPTNSYYYALKDDTKTVRLVWIYPRSLLSKTVYDFRFKKVLALSPDNIKEIHFEKKDLNMVLARKKKHVWQILSPIRAKGDRYAIEAFISTATDEKVIRFLDNPPNKPDIFGWNHPRMKISLICQTAPTKKSSSASAKKSTVILVGKNRDEGHVYVKIEGAPTVMIVSAKYVKGLDKKLFDFRDKNVWNYDIDNVTSVKYENPETHLIIAAVKSPKKDTWTLTSPEKTRADTRAVEDWLWDLSGFRIKKFLTKDELTSLSTAPLPSYRCLFELRVKGTKSPLTLKLFQIKGQWIAHLNGNAWYDVLDPKDVTKAFKTAFELKYRRLLDFEDTDVTRLQIRQKGQTLTFKKKKIRWYLIDKNGKRRTVPNIDVLNFLWELSDLKYDRVLHPMENLAPHGTDVKIFDKNGKSLGHLFFSPSKDKKGTVFKVEGTKATYFIKKQETKKFENAYHKLVQDQKKNQIKE